MPAADDIEVYRRCADDLVRYATSLVGPDEAADVVADAVLGAMSSATWATVIEQRAFLYRAVFNRAMSLHRATGRRRRRDHAARVSPVASDTVDAADSSIDAHRALATLSGQQRAVVYLTYWEDLRPADVAALLGVGEGTVRKQLARAREHLRKVL